MNSAARTVVSTLGAIMGLAGIEHGIGEILQGNTAPAGAMILSWPDSAFFRNLGGEPAMTILPNLLVTGILAVLISVAYLTWAVFFIQRIRGGLVLILLAIPMLLFGGGIFPPVLGAIVGAAATRLRTSPTAGGPQFSPAARRILSRLWPWAFAACLLAWLSLAPGISLLGYYFGVDDPVLILIVLMATLVFSPLAFFTGRARDAMRADRVMSVI